MSRPVSRSPLRYGLPVTDRTTADLIAAGLGDSGGTLAGSHEVLAALARAGRPELALAGLAELAGSAEHWPQISELLHQEPRYRARVLAVLGSSTALGEHLVQHPEDHRLLVPELASGDLLPTSEAYAVLAAAVGVDPGEPLCTGSSGARATLTGPRAVTALRRAYRGELMLIAAHDLAQAIEPSLPAVALPAVCHALSDLADALLQVGLSVASAGLTSAHVPARLAVVAMGKTGARELNYLSDVDVIFVADHPVPAEGASTVDDGRMLATATFLASSLMRICGSVAWEVDANLRPEGAAGALVRTPASHAAYYQRWAETWEFQALLKARAAAGDRPLGVGFQELTAPGVWSASARDSFVDDVQAMRRRVESLIPEQLKDKELKLGSGGLRDVEFSVQLMQLVHGRTDEDLRAAGTLMGLRALIRGGYVGRSDGAELSAAYTFLRRVEHRIQLQRLRRTHLLPTDPADLDWLARSLGYSAEGVSEAAEVFATERARHSATVRRLHEKLFYRPLLHAVAAVADDELRLSPEAATARLSALGFRSPDAALRHLAALTSGVSRRAAIQRTLLPVLLDTFAASPDPDQGLLSYRQVSEAHTDTPWYLRLLRDEGEVAHRLADLLGTSRLIGDLLTRAPDVLPQLVSNEMLTRAEPAQVAAALLAKAARANNPQDAVNAARSARRHEMARIACADLLGCLPVVEVVSGLTSVAEATIAAALRAAVDRVTAERGSFPVRLSVIAMGRLGGAEMGYSSDADVMYVAEPLPDAEPGPALAAATAAVDLLGRMLGRPSPDPSLEIDAALRPEGRNGPLVRTLESFQNYWQRFALPWERQALVRARPIAGDEELGERFVSAANLFRYPDGGLSDQDVREIRRIKARVDNERLPRGADRATHTKLGSGGLADVEWTAQLLQLQHGFEVPGLRTTSTLDALRAAVSADLITVDDQHSLEAAWLLATRVRNVLMLVTGKSEDQIPRQGRALRAVSRALGWSASADPGEFVDDYRRTTRRARWVVERVFEGGG